MADFSSVNIPPPKDWQAFERSARVLYACVLQDPLTQTNGTSGQRQHGVDIFGHRGGGDGPLVGIQCKGKGGSYGKKVTEKELRAELKKSEKFQPKLAEFILITTASDDAEIQESARLIEVELRADGRDIAVAVLGWGQLQALIAKYPEAIRAFSPDSTPFSDQIISEQAQIKALVANQGEKTDQKLEALLSTVSALVAQRPSVVAADPSPSDSVDQAINEQINSYRDLIRDGQPKTALVLLKKLKESRFSSSSDKIKYRILANIAASHHRMGEYAIAADLFIEAFPFNPDDPPAIANKIAALSMTGRHDEAHTLALEALARFPTNEDLAFQRLQTLGDNENLEDVWHSLAPEARHRAESYMVRIAALREASDARWHAVLVNARAEFPDHRYLKAIAAEEILESHLSVDASGLGGAGGPTVDELRWAADVFRDLWQEMLTSEIKADAAFAYNAALIYMFLGEPDQAVTLLDQALAKGDVDDELIRLRVSMHARRGEYDKAIELSERLKPSPKSLVTRAELLIRRNPKDVLELLKDRSVFTGHHEAIAAAMVAIGAHTALNDFPGALAEVERLKQTGDHAHYHLEKYRIFKAQGNAEADGALDAALASVNDETDLPTRYLIGEALDQQERYDEVVDLLAGQLNPAIDSPALRMLISAAANADRRATLSEILDAVPKELLKTAFFRRARAALALRLGDARTAEVEIRAYLAQRPQSLHMHLQLLQVLVKQDKVEDVKLEIAKPASQFQGQPEELMRLAQLKDAYGDWREAHDLAYRTWMANQGNAAVTMLYMGVFVRPGHSQELDIKPGSIALDMAIGLKIDQQVSTFVIESDPVLRPTAFYVAPDHAVAEALLGKSVGDAVSLPDGASGTIAWIKPKQLHALQLILETFSLTFPSAEGFESVKGDFRTEEGRKPIAERLQEQSRVINEVFENYSSGQLTLGLAARMLRTDPVALMLGLIEQGRMILSNEGTQLERDYALSALVKHGKKGCVVDAATMHIIRRFDLEKAVVSVCGGISIVEETAMLVQEKISKLLERPDKPDMSLMWRDGQIVRHEVSPEQKADALQIVQEDKEWLTKIASIEPAKGTKDPSPEFRSLMQRFGSEFIDDVLAAQGSGKILVSEDKLLRALARTEFGVEGTWLQPVLMRATVLGDMTKEEYATAVHHLIESNIDYISVDPDLLTWSMKESADLPLPQEFLRVTGRLGGANADLPSHVGVALKFVARVWPNETKSPILRMAAVSRLIEQISRDRTLDELYSILYAFRLFARRDLQDEKLVTHVTQWAKGHFIPLPKELAVSAGRRITRR